MTDKPNDTSRLSPEDIKEIRESVLETVRRSMAGEDRISDKIYIADDFEDEDLDIKLIADAVKSFSNVRESLLETHPLLGQPLKRFLPEVSEYRTGTIATDGKKLFINPSWWTNKPHAELRHTAAFISMTIINDLINRGDAIKDLDRWRWQMACNLVTNRLLIDQGIGILPDKGCFITSINGQMTSEDVYAMLVKMTRAEVVKAVWPLESVNLVSSLEDWEVEQLAREALEIRDEKA